MKFCSKTRSVLHGTLKMFSQLKLTRTVNGRVLPVVGFAYWFFMWSVSELHQLRFFFMKPGPTFGALS